MNRRLFLKMAGLIPMMSILRGTNAFGLPRQLGSHVKNQGTLNSLFSIFEGNMAPRLIVAAGRPSMGKASFMLNFLNEVGVELSKSSLYFSLEMSKKSLMMRLISLRSGISISSLRSGKISNNDWGPLVESEKIISDSKIFLDDSAGISVEEIRRRVERQQQKHQCIKFVFVDYFQLIGAEQEYLCRKDHVEDVLSQLKIMAKDLKVVVVAAAQLNRGVEGRSNKRPQPEDLREVRDLSAIDELLLLYRESYYDKSTTKNVIEISRFVNNQNCDAIWIGDMSLSNQKISNIKKVV